MTPMEFTRTVRCALLHVVQMYDLAHRECPSDVTEALAMLDPEPEAAPPLLQFGPGGDFVEKWTPKR